MRPTAITQSFFINTFSHLGLSLIPVTLTGIQVLGARPDLAIRVNHLRSDRVTGCTTGGLTPSRKDTCSHNRDACNANSQSLPLPLIDTGITDVGTVADCGTTLRTVVSHYMPLAPVNFRALRGRGQNTLRYSDANRRVWRRLALRLMGFAVLMSSRTSSSERSAHTSELRH